MTTASYQSISTQTDSLFFDEVKKVASIWRNYNLWLNISWNDLKSRYRRTILGPIWFVLATGITISAMAVVWSIIFHIDLKQYFPQLATSMICWAYISATFVESGSAFITQASLIQNLPLHIHLHVIRLLCRNVFIFFHNFLILLLVYLCFHTGVTLNSLLFIPGFILLGINIYCMSFVFAVIGTRYRDFPQLLTSLFSVAIYVTPVMWQVEMLGKYWYIAYLNPLTHFLYIIQKPLLGQCPPIESILVSLILSFINVILMFVFSKKYSHRIAYWV